MAFVNLPGPCHRVNNDLEIIKLYRPIASPVCVTEVVVSKNTNEPSLQDNGQYSSSCFSSSFVNQACLMLDLA